MYRELQHFRKTLNCELKACLFPAVAGVDPNRLLETYLDQLPTFGHVATCCRSLLTCKKMLPVPVALG